MNIEECASPAAWRTHLINLPELDAPPAVWEGLMATRRRRRRNRVAGWAMAACMVMAVTAAFVGGSWPVEQSVSVADVAARSDMMRSGVGMPASLREIDDALARAYATQRAEAELQALWDARSRVLESTTSGREPMLVQL